MMPYPLTSQQSSLLAHRLTLRHASDDVEKFAGALAEAQVDLNPHQVDAALFAFQSPLSKGAILADEVGLGKTIEAGLVIAQKWAERKRRVLVITPANLRKQWFSELTEKFFLPCEILESKSYNSAWRSGREVPFESSNVVICSYQFARAKAAEVRRVHWDLVVIDEAHRLRNVYKTSNILATELKHALEKAPKILLTATPLQNNLLELFGLVSIIDERTFGDLSSFREQFSNLNDPRAFVQLRERLKSVCHRTLRRQVQAYIKYTKRHALVEEFTPARAETELYEAVGDYLQRDNLQALPNSQRNLITLVLRKLLASSTFAIAGALGNMRDRLQTRLDKDAKRTEQPFAETLADYEALDETADEWGEQNEAAEPLSAEDRAAIQKEITDLDCFYALASSIEDNAKGQALLIALKAAFAKAKELGAKRKAIIFTESKRTQAYLLRLLETTEHAGKVVLFNGSNNDQASRKIHAAWLERHRSTDQITNTTADVRSALVDEFRERAEIMIATEAGAEGINLQFCALVVNYDLPWNPQRIEQRIGRCHRYGQAHDVVVVNFLNRNNEADQRVFELLEQKFKLFDGVFGSSDEVLGAIESGVDFEKRIAGIYQQCRTPTEIQTAFDALQAELSVEIGDSMQNTRQKLLEHFDEEVNERLKIRVEQSQNALNRFEQVLMRLSQHELADVATFDENGFVLHRDPTQSDIPLGRYELPRRNPEAHFYRLSDKLAQFVISSAKNRLLEPSILEFNYETYNREKGKISMLEHRRGQQGWLRVSKYSISALTQTEDHLIIVGGSATESLEPELLGKLLELPARVVGTSQTIPNEISTDLETQTQAEQRRVHQEISERNAQFFEQEAARLDAWAEDLKIGLERELKDIDRQIKEARRAASLAMRLEEKLEGQKRIKQLEATRSQKRRALFDAQDEIDAQRGKMIEELEGKLQQEAKLETIFTIQWRLT
jgi:ERCC4-related helicase